jgi:DNA recombination protein RmuC
MPTEHTLLLALFGLLALTVGLLALLIYLVLSDRHRRGAEGDDLCDALLEGVAGAKREIEGTVAKTDARLSAGLSSLITYSTTEQKRSSESVERFAASARGDLARMNETLAKEFLALQSMVDERFAKVLQTNAGAQEALGAKLSAALAEVRGTVDASLEKVRAENAQKLEAMRATVEEKLDRTLSERLSASFRMVDEKLGLVQSGLGEMRRMAQSVSRLQNVLANVKTRGTFGEVRLAAILSEILTPAQYAAQARSQIRRSG